MDEDEVNWKEHVDKLREHKNDISEEEIDSFMQRIDKVDAILKNMRSGNEETIKLGMTQADEMLGNHLEGVEINEDKLRVKKDRCIINRNAYKEEPKKETLEMEAFKRSVEVDANKRAEDRRQRKEVADRYKNEGNKAFRSGNYTKALDSYNKALDEVKDSCVLYNNRALTLLRLGLPKRVLEDTDKALRLNESSLKALLYKAQAHHELRQSSEASDCAREALDKHPQHKKQILEYTKDWYDETYN